MAGVSQGHQGELPIWNKGEKGKLLRNQNVKKTLSKRKGTGVGNNQPKKKVKG